MNTSGKFPEDQPPTNTQKSWLGELNAIISDQLHDPSLTIPKIAEALYMSERQFYRRVKKETGYTPNQYLQVARLAKARDLLRGRKSITVKEAALSVGYSRPDYFSKLFEAYFGIRPAALARSVHG